MSDLSVPPLSLVPLGQEGTPPPAPARGAGAGHGVAPCLAPPPLPATRTTFAWPTPELPTYPGPTPSAKPAACELEGLNGHTMTGRLLHFDVAEGVVASADSAGALADACISTSSAACGSCSRWRR